MSLAVVDPETSGRGRQETSNKKAGVQWPYFYGICLQAGGGRNGPFGPPGTTTI